MITSYKFMKSILSQFDLMIISKYFDNIVDYVNLSKTCKIYNVIDKYNYNPLPINIDQLLIFENLDTIIIENSENDYINIIDFMANNKSILKHLKHKLNVNNKSDANILKFKDYFNEIQTNLTFTDWIDNGCNTDESKYVTKIDSGTFDNNEDIKYIVLPQSVNEICERAIVNCPNLLFIISPRNRSEMFVHERNFKKCNKYQGIIFNDDFRKLTKIITIKDNAKHIINKKWKSTYYSTIKTNLDLPKKYSQYDCENLFKYISNLVYTKQLKEGIYYNDFNLFENKIICKIYQTPKNIYFKPCEFIDNEIDENYFIMDNNYNYSKQFYNYAYINQCCKYINDYPNFNDFILNELGNENSVNENIIKNNVFYARYSMNDLYDDIINFGKEFGIMKMDKSLLKEWCIECSSNINNFRKQLEEHIELGHNTDNFIDKIIKLRFSNETNYDINDIDKLKNENIIELINDYSNNNEFEKDDEFNEFDKFIDELFSKSKDEIKKLNSIMFKSNINENNKNEYKFNALKFIPMAISSRFIDSESESTNDNHKLFNENEENDENNINLNNYFEFIENDKFKNDITVNYFENEENDENDENVDYFENIEIEI